MLGIIHLLLWLYDRRSRIYLLSSLMALSAGAGALIELALLQTESVETYSLLVKWQHLAIFLILVPMAWFVYFHFQTARRWLAVIITGLWGIAVAANFLSPSSLTFSVVHHLEPQVSLWGEEFTTPVATVNPLAMSIASLSSLKQHALPDSDALN